SQRLSALAGSTNHARCLFLGHHHQRANMLRQLILGNTAHLPPDFYRLEPHPLDRRDTDHRSRLILGAAEVVEQPFVRQFLDASRLVDESQFWVATIVTNNAE